MTDLDPKGLEAARAAVGTIPGAWLWSAAEKIVRAYLASSPTTPVEAEAVAGKTHCHREGGCIRAFEDETCGDENQCSIILDIAAAVSALQARVRELEGVLRPFATVGRIIDGPFGPALFAEDEMAFQSGCAWSEDGERKILTWGDFRKARAALVSHNPPEMRDNANSVQQDGGKHAG